MHYYSFNIADYKKDTEHLIPIEHYIYRALIDRYYLDEKPIPLKTQSVMRRLSLVGDEHETMLENVLSDFFHKCDDGYRHKRIDAELEKYQSNAEKNRLNGAKGGRPRKNKPKLTQSVTDDIAARAIGWVGSGGGPDWRNRDVPGAAGDYIITGPGYIQRSPALPGLLDLHLRHVFGAFAVAGPPIAAGAAHRWIPLSEGSIRCDADQLCAGLAPRDDVLHRLLVAADHSLA